MSKVVSITKNKSADFKTIRKALAALEAEKILYKELYALKTKPVEKHNHDTWMLMVNNQIEKVNLAKSEVETLIQAYKDKYGETVHAEYEGVHAG